MVLVTMALAGCGNQELGAVGGPVPGFVDESAVDAPATSPGDAAIQSDDPDEGMQSMAVATHAYIGSPDGGGAEGPAPPGRLPSPPTVDPTDPQTSTTTVVPTWHERTVFLSISVEEAITAYTAVYEERGFITTTQLSTSSQGPATTVFAVDDGTVVASAEITSTRRGTMVIEGWLE
jgi:hypothetical protein